MIHPGLTKEKWESLQLEEQMGNIGAEVARLLNRIRQNDSESARLSLERALELIDLTVSDPKWRGRSKELLRLREVLCGRVYSKDVYSVTDEELMNYFLPFAILARSKL